MDVPIAICFFGIVKTHRGIFTSIRKKILDVLKKQGLPYHIYLHTYDLKEITNKRTGEHMISIRCKCLEKSTTRLLGNNRPGDI